MWRGKDCDLAIRGVAGVPRALAVGHDVDEQVGADFRGQRGRTLRTDARVQATLHSSAAPSVA